MKAFSGSVSCVSLFALPFFVPKTVKAVLVFISARLLGCHKQLNSMCLNT